MDTKFEFQLNTRIRFGAGTRHAAQEAILKEGWKRVGIVVDHNLIDSSMVRELVNSLERITAQFAVGICTIAEPTYDALEEMRGTLCDPELQAIIGLGGGSAIDMAKAMAVLVHNHRPAIEYRGFDKITEPVLPIIAIPTTAGTGTEITPNASFVDSKEKRKMGINGEAVRPLYSFLDPELTLSCPKEPTLSAAVDSLVHATEAYAAKKTTAFARLFALEGFKRVYNKLRQVLSNPHDIETRSEVMYGAFLSGVALMHSGSGPAAAMSYPLGVHYQIPHGIGGGIFLPYVVTHNVTQGITSYADLYQSMDGVEVNLDRPQQAENFAQNLLSTLREAGIPGDINQYGFSMESVDSFVAETMELKSALDQNPTPFYENEIRNTLRHLTNQAYG